MSINKRYRWMVLDHKGRLKLPEEIVYTTWGLHPNRFLGGEFESELGAESSLGEYIKGISMHPEAAHDHRKHEFVLLAFYTKTD